MNPLEELFLNNPMGELATDDMQLQSPYLPEDEGLSFLTPINELASEETESKTSSAQRPFLDNYGDSYRSHVDHLKISVPALEKQHLEELQKKYPPLVSLESVKKTFDVNNIKEVDIGTSNIKHDSDHIKYLNLKTEELESPIKLVEPSLSNIREKFDFFNRDTKILITDLNSVTRDEFYEKFSPITVIMPKETEIENPLKILADFKQEDYSNDFIAMKNDYASGILDDTDHRKYVAIEHQDYDKQDYREDIVYKSKDDPHTGYLSSILYESKENEKIDYKDTLNDYKEEPSELKHPEDYKNPVLNPDSEEQNFLKDDTGKPIISLVNTVKSGTSVRKEAWQTVETTDKIQATDITPSSNFDKTIGNTMSPSIERKIGEETVKIPARKVAWENVEQNNTKQTPDINEQTSVRKNSTENIDLPNTIKGSSRETILRNQKKAWVANVDSGRQDAYFFNGSAPNIKGSYIGGFLNNYRDYINVYRRCWNRAVNLNLIQAPETEPSDNFDPLIGDTIGTGLIHVLNGSGDDYDVTKREAAWMFVNSRGKPKKISLDSGNPQFDATKNSGFAKHTAGEASQDPYFENKTRNPFVSLPDDLKHTFRVDIPVEIAKSYNEAVNIEKLMWQGYQLLQSTKEMIPEFIVTRPMMNWYKGQTLYTGIEYLNDTMVLADANYMISNQALASAPLATANVTHGYNYDKDLRTFQSDEEKRKAFRGLESVQNLRTASGDTVDFGTDFYWNIFFDYPEENKAHLPRFPYSGWMPVMSYQLNGIKSKTIEQETMLGSIVVPMLYELPSSIDITLPETCHMDVDHWLRSYFAAIYGSEEIHSIMALDKRKVKIRPYKQQCLYIKLAWYTQQWNIIRTRKFICIPNFDFTYKGDESIVLKTISLTFNIVGSDGLDHVPVQFASGSRDVGNTSVEDSVTAHMGPAGATLTMAKNLASAFSPGEAHRTMDIQQRTTKDLLIRG